MGKMVVGADRLVVDRVTQTDCDRLSVCQMPGREDSIRCLVEL